VILALLESIIQPLVTVQLTTFSPSNPLPTKSCKRKMVLQRCRKWQGSRCGLRHDDRPVSAKTGSLRSLGHFGTSVTTGVRGRHDVGGGTTATSSNIFQDQLWIEQADSDFLDFVNTFSFQIIQKVYQDPTCPP
jgi:hypothetical protein